MKTTESNSKVHLALAAIAAFSTYFCMYAFRKPFTAATFEDQGGVELGFLTIAGLPLVVVGFKTMLIFSQLTGYMLSKVIGIKVVSEMQTRNRAATILALIVFSELALVGFAYFPMGWKPVMLFLNGLPLGMVFGLVMSYLEGRKQTEALSAVLCASFIMSSGVVKSIGQWLIQDMGFDPFQMPMITGLMFLPLLFCSVWLLQTTPVPDAGDRRERSERKAMNRAARWSFFKAFWPGLCLILLVYVAITLLRTIRDDFGVEIWRDMGVTEEPWRYATSEFIVAVCVTVVNAGAIWITHNLMAIRVTLGLMCGSFLLVGAAAGMQSLGWLGPLGFMVACGIGLYMPYVAFHTTIFERLVAASGRPANLGFLLYLADSLGYLGYAVVLIARNTFETSHEVLPYFLKLLVVIASLSCVSLVIALLYFQKVLSKVSADTAAVEK
ncbi:MAG: DUF5690 family protein [Rubripirellula sp.]|nr:DUF5690 family protein [Rubripirellula sp.]